MGNPVSRIADEVSLTVSRVHLTAGSVDLQAGSVHLTVGNVDLKADSVGLLADVASLKADSVHLIAGSADLQARSVDLTMHGVRLKANRAGHTGKLVGHAGGEGGERGSVSRSTAAMKERLKCSNHQRAAEVAAGRRPALRRNPCFIRVHPWQKKTPAGFPAGAFEFYDAAYFTAASSAVNNSAVFAFKSASRISPLSALASSDFCAR